MLVTPWANRWLKRYTRQHAWEIPWPSFDQSRNLKDFSIRSIVLPSSNPLRVFVPLSPILFDPFFSPERSSRGRHVSKEEREKERGDEMAGTRRINFFPRRRIETKPVNAQQLFLIKSTRCYGVRNSQPFLTGSKLVR